MLLILIPTVWLAVVLFVLAMCRVAARSDDSHAVALTEWIATSNLAEHEAAPADSPDEQLVFDPQRGVERAAG